MSEKEKEDLITILTVIIAFLGMIVKVQGGEKNV